MTESKKAAGSSAVARRSQAITQEVAGRIEFTEDQIALIKSIIAPDASPDELKIFLHQCRRTGLDPLTRQIYCIHRNDHGKKKMTVQTSIDGFRVIAERSGSYAGQSKPVFFYDTNNKLECCEVTVFKFSPSGERYEAATAVAFWKEYALTTGLWPYKPHVMLSKVAEALALRKAFPQDLSGLYTEEEIPPQEPGRLSIEIENDKARPRPASTPIDLEKERLKTTHFEEAQIVAPEPPVNAVAWAYTKAMQAELIRLLGESLYEPGAEEYKSVLKYIEQTAGARMTQGTHNKILASLRDPKNKKPAAMPELALGDAWSERLAACKTQKDLVALYQKYAQEVNASPELQKRMKDKREALNYKDASQGS